MAGEGGRPRLSREIADLIIHGAHLDASLARGLLGLQFRPLEETLSAFDAWADRFNPRFSNEVHPR